MELPIATLFVNVFSKLWDTLVQYNSLQINIHCYSPIVECVGVLRLKIEGFVIIRIGIEIVTHLREAVPYTNNKYCQV